MKKIISLLLILCFVVACSSGEKFKLITTNEAIKLIEEGATVLDVRTVEEYDREHIKGAINIPVDIIDTIDLDKDLDIIVYCQSGIRSQKAVERLAQLGYKKLYNLDGGLLNWGGDLEEK